jgi:thiosulfate reductase cytochrome b subunit
MQAVITARHSVLVRVTHWVNTLAFLALLVSGFAILLAHPRLYWGESGGYESPALLDLPLPLNTDESGWGRALHFLAAWVTVVNGVVYVISGLSRKHFQTGFTATYNSLQKLVYLGVVFVFFPLMIMTGLAMSPAITSVVPGIVTVFGGYQSARTIHFFASGSLVAFLFIHVAMVYLAGFRNRVREMTLA